MRLQDFLCLSNRPRGNRQRPDIFPKPPEGSMLPDPQSLVLVGDRFRPLKYDEMTIEQKTMVDHLLAGERQGARGPFNVLLRSPEVGDLAQQFGGAMRFHTALPKDVSETIIIMTGRFWMAQYEWTAHKAAALKNGVNPAIVDAIASGNRPTGMSPEMDVASTSSTSCLPRTKSRMLRSKPLGIHMARRASST